MSKFVFKTATKEKLKLRLALAGVSGGGKTYTALRVAHHLTGGSGNVAVIDSERGSARLYAPKPGEKADESKGTFAFKHCELESFHPREYIEAIDAAEAEVGPDGCVVIDSASHAWFGKDGLLEEVDKLGAKMGSKFNAWGPAGKLQNELIDRILNLKCHAIVTLRTKMEHVQEKDERGRTVVKKVGMKVIQRDDVEYEFTVYATMDQDNNLIVNKTRCSALNPDQKHGGVFNKPGKEFVNIITAWLDAGGEPEAKAPEESPVVKAKKLIDACQSKDDLTAVVPQIGKLLPKGVASDEERKEVSQYLAEASKVFA